MSRELNIRCGRLIYLVSFVLVLGLISGVAWSEVLVDLRARDLAYGTGVTTWPNRGTLGDFMAHGAPVVEDVDGRKAVTFDGSSWFEGPASIPSIEGAGSRTIEVWAYNPSIASEETMVSWARRGQPSGSNMAFNYGGSVTHGAADHWSPGDSTQNLGYTGAHSPAPAAGIWWHLVYTYDGQTARIYVNAVEETANEGVGVLNTFGGYSIRIAAQGDNTGTDIHKALSFTGSLAEVRIYDQALTLQQIQRAMKSIALEATNPSPAHKKTDVARDLILSWTPGMHADKHDIYFGTNFEDVNNADRINPLDVLISRNQDANSYSPAELLQFDQTYYWRIDEVNAPPDYTVYKGEVWQFTAELFAPPMPSENITATASSSNTADEGPENTVNGSGLDANDLHSEETLDMWLSSITGPQPTWIQYEFDKAKLHEMLVWNHNSSVESFVGFGVKDATIEYSTDGNDWTALGDFEFAQAPGSGGYAYNTMVDLSSVIAKYVKITAKSNWGGFMPQYGLSEVCFFYIPVFAREPNPASGATDMNVGNVTLSWRAGRGAASHEVQLSNDEQAVIDGTAPVVSVSGTSYDTGELNLAQTYYWKVNEVNEAETPATWQGNVWNFSTQEYLVVDDFEDYNNTVLPYDTWKDGLGDDNNGSEVGYDIWTPGPHYNGPLMEETIVHGGEQSMPIRYSNTGGASYAEATRTFASAQDWTKNGVTTLVLYFYGDVGNTGGGQMYVKVNGTKLVCGGDAGALSIAEWTQCNIDLSSVGGLQSVTTLSIGIDGVGAAGIVYVDDILLYRVAP